MLNHPAEICIVRHGETDWNAKGILQGSLDVPLNATGLAQARALSGQFAGCGLVAIHSSPLKRALDTARLIAEALALPVPMTHARLCERNFGSLQGVAKAELAQKDPQLSRQIVERDPTAPFPDGESLDTFAERVLQGLAEIAALHAGERCLLVSHGWVMDVITRQAQGLPRTTRLPIKRRNGEAVWVAASGDQLVEIAAPLSPLPATE